MDSILEFVEGGLIIGGTTELAKQVFLDEEIDIGNIAKKSVHGGVFGLGMGLLDDILD